MRWYGMSLVSANYDLCSALDIAIMHRRRRRRHRRRRRRIKLSYNGTWLYNQHDTY